MLIRFQSTLPRGERQINTAREVIKNDFNPRSHGGSDDIIDVIPFRDPRFQSTLPRGERRKQTFLPTEFLRRFQSTLPRGERRQKYKKARYVINFNPRSHGGSDHKDQQDSEIYTISIHAPTGGATAKVTKFK